MDWKHLLAYITGTVDQELLLRNEYLVTENRPRMSGGCHQRQCSYSTHLFRHLREAMNHPKGLCQNLS